MNITILSTYLARALFILALAMFGVAVLEIVTNQFNYTVLGQSYSPGRLIELSAAVMVFVIAHILRQIRDK